MTQIDYAEEVLSADGFASQEIDGQESKAAKKSKWRTLVALSLGYFVDQGEAQAMSIFSPVLRQLWGLSIMNLSWITFVRSLLQSLSSPFWGYLADKYNRKKVFFGELASGVSGLLWWG